MDREPGENGMAMIIAMGVIVVGMLISTAAFVAVRTDWKSTSFLVKRTKAEYVAESALNWALSLVSAPPAFTAATHDSLGYSLDDSVIVEGYDRLVPNCDKLQLIDVVQKVYPSLGVNYDGEGWLCQESRSTDLSLSGSGYEKVRVKVLYRDARSVEIEAWGIIGTEGGKNDTAAVVLKGELQALPRYSLISDGDITPTNRRTMKTEATMHANGNIYLGVAEDEDYITTSSLTASGNIYYHNSPYVTAGEAKETFVEDNDDDAGDPFPPVNSMENLWRDFQTVKINGITVAESDESNGWSRFLEVSQHVPRVPMPEYSFDSMTQTLPCYSCKPVVVPPETVIAHGGDIDVEWFFNPQYGAGRNQGQTYYGYHFRTAGGANGNLAAARNGNSAISFGTYTESGTIHSRHYGTSTVRNFQEDLDTYLGRIGQNRKWDELFHGGAYGGEWVKVRLLNLGNRYNYPSRCPRGGVLHFGDQNVMIVNAQYLHYPVTVYTTGEIYLVGDFNCGLNFRGDTCRAERTSCGNSVGKNLANGSIKPAAVIADSNRIWYLSYGFYSEQYGLNISGSDDPDNAFDRDGYRLRRGISGSEPPYISSRFKKKDGTTWYSPAAVVVGVFVTGAPMMDEAFYVSSKAHGAMYVRAPTAFENFKYKPAPLGGDRLEFMVCHIGMMVNKCNAVLEGDWDPSSGSYDGSYSYTPPAGYGGYANRTGDFWPPQPGRIAPRYARGYTSFTFTFTEADVAEPVHRGRVLLSKSIYKK